MASRLILASGSSVRARLLENAGVPFSIETAKLDEGMIRRSLEADGANARDIVDALAESKARKISNKHEGALVLGCDQVLEFNGKIYSKPDSQAELRTQMQELRGHQHRLLSGAVICRDGVSVWRFIGQVRLNMRDFSDAYMDDYIMRNWDNVRHCVGGYMLEAEGVRLFEKIDGDYFSVLGMPLVEILSYLTLNGELPQ